MNSSSMTSLPPARAAIQPFLVTAEQMQQIEQRLFDAGMPVAALMEKVSERIAEWFIFHYGLLKHGNPGLNSQPIGVLAGPGHNGGDALVVARELHHLGYAIRVYQPFAHCKPLTEQHAQYARHLGMAFVDSLASLAECGAIIDGWFGFGLTRAITGELAADIQALNQQQIPIFSIDLPSGIQTDSGQVMGVALKAHRTACLGLWKQGVMAESALAYLGDCDLIDFDIPLSDISAVLGEALKLRRVVAPEAIAYLPLERSPTAHKYKAGHLLLIAGSRQYAGAALLTGLGAIASGVGMLTLAVPESIRLALLPQLPGALLIGCPESDLKSNLGAIASLPDSLDLSKYDAIALGPGLTPTVATLLHTVLKTHCPLLLDADGLNLLAQGDSVQQLQARSAFTAMPTVLTPHAGEFKRLFPHIDHQTVDSPPGERALMAAQDSGAIIVLKGPRSTIASGQKCWFNPHSTAALARGGSGDVLTGLMGGLMATAAQQSLPETTSEAIASAAISAVWWHSQAAIYASHQRTLLGVDPLQLTQSLNPSLRAIAHTTGFPLTPHGQPDSPAEQSQHQRC